jgi:hypothetical protein
MSTFSLCYWSLTGAFSAHLPDDEGMELGGWISAENGRNESTKARLLLYAKTKRYTPSIVKVERMMLLEEGRERELEDLFIGQLISLSKEIGTTAGPYLLSCIELSSYMWESS